MRFSTSDIARLVGGTVVGPEVVVDGATNDSRQVRGGELFVAIRAERDGHDFIGAALESGAAAYLSAEPARGGTAVVVDDTQAALERLGAAARDRLPDRVVAITGSVGKTSTKDLLVAALHRAGPVAASPRSFNNEIGVPLTLLGAPDDARVVVVEMGARGGGHIARLCRIARPTIGVVTRVGASHTAAFGTIEDVARAKAELVEALAPTATAVLNADDPNVIAMATAAAGRVVTFGQSAAADVRVTLLALDDELRPLVCMETSSGTVEVRIAARGAHQATNSAAATAAALSCGARLSDILDGLSSAVMSGLRMQLEHAPCGALILDDSYNANPMSVVAALEALVRLPAARHTAVLGGMAELGALSADEHRRIGALARSMGIRVIALDPAYEAGEVVGDATEAQAALGALGPGDAVLVKGSRVAGLDDLAGRLARA